MVREKKDFQSFLNFFSLFSDDESDYIHKLIRIKTHLKTHHFKREEEHFYFYFYFYYHYC